MFAFDAPEGIGAKAGYGSGGIQVHTCLPLHCPLGERFPYLVNGLM